MEATKQNVANLQMKTIGTKSKYFTARTLVTIGILSGLSYALMLLESPPYIGFLRLELSDIPAIIGAFQFGPLAGVIIELIKNLIKAITATKTAGIGELANFLISIAYVVPAAFLYRKLKTKHKAWIAFGVATISLTVAGFVVNYFITIPLYAKLYGGIDNVVKVASVIPAIKDKFTLILYGISPFNLLNFN
ncbi:MAG TPA: ECF transporter S component [Paludibacter sp.]|nr:ECF transporter S component [Paludibacter sp.]